MRTILAHTPESHVHTVLLYNPLSGAGRAAREAKAVAHTLAKAGFSPSPVEVGPGARKVLLEDELSGANAIVVIGGDGTVHHAAMPAARANTPIYHYPMGTENLFAREFAMNRDHNRLLDALNTLKAPNTNGIPPITYVDAATANGRPFLLMASLGVDANVVHRLSRNRTGAISHMSYAPHIVKELISPFLRPLTITADGQRILNHKYATVIIANMRQYAMRVDPAHQADPTDGMLDLVVLPGKHWVRTLGWFARARLRRLHLEDRAKVVRAKSIQVFAHNGNVPYQIDGEAPLAIASEPTDEPATTPLDIRTIERVVPVLTGGIPAGHPTRERMLKSEAKSDAKPPSIPAA